MIDFEVHPLTPSLFTSPIEDMIREMQRIKSELPDVEAKSSKTGLPERLWHVISVFANRLAVERLSSASMSD